MIYVPDLENYKNFSIIDENTIRAYKQSDTNNVEYRDYYINSHYIYNDGIEDISQTLPVYIDNSNLTDSIYYRNDFDSILVIFVILSYILIYLPIKLVLKLFKKG